MDRVTGCFVALIGEVGPLRATVIADVHLAVAAALDVPLPI